MWGGREGGVGRQRRWSRGGEARGLGRGPGRLWRGRETAWTGPGTRAPGPGLRPTAPPCPGCLRPPPWSARGLSPQVKDDPGAGERSAGPSPGICKPPDNFLGRVPGLTARQGRESSSGVTAGAGRRGGPRPGLVGGQLQESPAWTLSALSRPLGRHRSGGSVGRGLSFSYGGRTTASLFLETLSRVGDEAPPGKTDPNGATIPAGLAD